MTTPDTRILDRSTALELSEHLDRAAGVLERIVNYGTHLLVKCDGAAVAEHQAAPLMIGRQIIEIIDAVSVLVRRRAVDPCKILIRTQIEAVMYLEYIAHADTDRRSLQYVVGHIHARIEDHLKHDPNTPQGKQVAAELRKDKTLRDVPIRPYDSTPRIANLRRILERPTHAPIEAEWQRMKDEQKQRRKENAGASPIHWYSLFGGPRTIQELARTLRNNGWYEWIYRLYAAEAHCRMGMRSLQPLKSGASAYKPLRDPLDLQTIFNFSATLGLNSYRLLHQIFLKDAGLDEFGAWYTHEIRADFTRVSSAQVVDPDRPLHE